MKDKIITLDLKFNEELKELKSPKKIIIHHTHNPNLTTLTTHLQHQERNKWAGIGYNYFIEMDGTVVEGRGMYIGAHAKNHNFEAIGIALAGNFDESIPSKEQMEELIELCVYFMKKYDIESKRVIGHRELEEVTKTCPGVNFDMHNFRNDILKKINEN